MSRWLALAWATTIQGLAKLKNRQSAEIKHTINAFRSRTSIPPTSKLVHQVFPEQKDWLNYLPNTLCCNLTVIHIYNPCRYLTFHQHISNDMLLEWRVFTLDFTSQDIFIGGNTISQHCTTSLLPESTNILNPLLLEGKGITIATNSNLKMCIVPVYWHTHFRQLYWQLCIPLQDSPPSNANCWPKRLQWCSTINSQPIWTAQVYVVKKFFTACKDTL